MEGRCRRCNFSEIYLHKQTGALLILASLNSCRPARSSGELVVGLVSSAGGLLLWLGEVHGTTSWNAGT